MTEDEARAAAQRDRDAFLDRLQSNGDAMAAGLSKKFGFAVEFELKPSRVWPRTASQTAPQTGEEPEPAGDEPASRT